MRIALICPEDPDRSWHGGTIRTAAFRRAFEELGHVVDLMLPRTEAADAPRSAVAMSTARSRLSSVKRAMSPMPTALGLLAQRGPQLRRQLDGFDLILFSNFESRIMVPRRLHARVWFDQSDAHSRYARSEAEHRTGVARLAAHGQSRWLRSRERRWVQRAAIATAAGYGDAIYSAGRHGTVSWLPTPVRVGRVTPTPGSRAIGMIGNFGYGPNRQAYETFVREWLPAVRSQGWRFVVAGRGSAQLPEQVDVELLGPVTDVADFYRAIDVAASPVERGGGIKVKSLEALVHGRPVLATTHTADGLPPELHALLVLSDSPTDLPPLDTLTPDPDQVAAARERFSEQTFTRHVAQLLDRWRTNVT